MKILLTLWLGLAISIFEARAQTGALTLPRTLKAGAMLSVPTSGTGEGVLYIVGPMQVLKRTLQLGDTVVFHEGELHNAGRYTAFLEGPSLTQITDFDVVAEAEPASISFLAKPSRLPVNLPDGISGVAYLFDAFHNLILEPTQVSFQLSETGGATQKRLVVGRSGAAWVQMPSGPKAEIAQFLATARGITEKRIVQEVPGDPCLIKMTARQAGDQIVLETEPLRDCRGNSVADGTVVTFTETYQDTQCTVDAPLKHGIARALVPAYSGSVISVASGVVMGNEIRYQAGR